ncbi:hypothetical protein BABINDRAFT_161677 [Babjeviella inositovora NRRL Y-12698]|uniref:HAD-like protein n=1 Tax=Babjeviella inositovora NRRL Y-12698 TaxID=984486 RepID=A0A1E3QSZ1_9ASCO|nr:uncharacterized protein BABINDRAFT_161677 [Babjeviella inositovora NRRL Y-12698]ODQ80037.1 hypothetical protein BABINDRAFT_161677 [Babjeviella inositovora NRRL Y-12698]
MLVSLRPKVILFDLDGTLVNSTRCVEKAWRVICKEHDVDAEYLFEHSHGVRTEEVFKAHFPNIPADQRSIAAFESTIYGDYADDAEEIMGSRELLRALDGDAALTQKWGIVTSGTRGLATTSISKVLKLNRPPRVFITAEQVTKGKPDPEGYNRGFELLRKQLDHAPEENLEAIVFEDAPAGIKAGVSSGATVIGITSTFDKEALLSAGCTYAIKDMTKVKVVANSRRGYFLEVDVL